MPLLADHLRGDQRIGTGPRAEVEYPLTPFQPIAHGLATPAKDSTAGSGTFASSSG
jgi:hypothetical protein